MKNILFQACFRVPRMAASKNEKTIRMNRGTGQRFIGKHDKTIECQEWILSHLNVERIKQRIDSPILCDLNAEFTFYFPKSVYFTKKDVRSKTLPDLSNLYELPQDCLQYNFCKLNKKHPQFKEIKIIGSDSQICSHDGSRRLPIDGTDYYLKIVLTEFKESGVC